MSGHYRQSEKCFSGYFSGLFPTILVILCAGCANPGPPRPPSLSLPAPVADLNAQRLGDRVVLRWTTPSRTTDDLPVKNGMTAQICREVGTKPGTSAEHNKACAPVLRLAVAPGLSEVSDPLPRQLIVDPADLIMYRVQIENAAGRSAGNSSMAAFAAAGLAPPPLESFSARAGESGAILEWRRPRGDDATYAVDIGMRDLSASPLKKPSPPDAHIFTGKRRHSNPTSAQTVTDEVHLRASETRQPKSELTGTVVPAAKIGDTYTYVATRVRSVDIGGHLLEIHSDPSPTVVLVMRDTFPPRAPAGLVSVPSVAATRFAAPANQSGGSSYIDLSWEPNIEPDLAGYFVYRQTTGPNGDTQGTRIKLTASPVSAPAYRDVAVTPGQRYSYSVTAVDASGSESAPSAQVEEALPPK